MGSLAKRILADFASLPVEEQKAFLAELTGIENQSFVPFTPFSASESEMEHLIEIMRHGLPLQEGPLKRNAVYER